MFDNTDHNSNRFRFNLHDKTRKPDAFLSLLRNSHVIEPGLDGLKYDERVSYALDEHDARGITDTDLGIGSVLGMDKNN